ncbi:MAG: NAD-dependent succinate-semialdehyde dehydrogenase [Pseudomonadota bacterium]
MTQSINPATEDLIETFDAYNDAEVDRRLDRAATRFETWRLTSFDERAQLMVRAADVLESNKQAYAETMTAEMGKTLASAIAEVEKCAWVCRHYAEHAEGYLSDEIVETDASQSFVRHLPLGPVLAVMPWNFPFWQVFRFAAPALMAGNIGLLKHASNVWRSALNIEAVFRDAGFPDGCFETLLIGSDKVEAILRDKRVRATTLTGSGPAGGAVASIAGSEIKPSVLELGGTDALIVMPSADLEAAVDTAVTARTQNNGQSCIAAKRFFVHRDIYTEFRDRFVAAFDALTVGDPMQDETDIGPLATETIREELIEQVEHTLSADGTRLTADRHLPDKGWYFAPVVIENAPLESPAYKDELFGPAAGLWSVESLEEAIAHANNTEFGLGSAIFTKDDAEIERAVRDLEAGSTFVNAKVSSDPRLPFGGIKQSGFGRELAADGIRAFVNRKTVSIA